MLSCERASGRGCLKVPDPSDSSPGLGLAFRALAITIQGNKHKFLFSLGLGSVAKVPFCAPRKVGLGEKTKLFRVH
jgi:hypothetical protein